MPRAEEAKPTQPEWSTSGASRGLGNVLVATDFSAAGRVALLRAAHLPFALGGRLELLHVAADTRDDADTQQRLREDRDQLIGGTIDASVIATVAHGDPVDVIRDRARHTRAELIVLGRRGENTLRAKLVGTTAQRIVRRGSTSTLIVSAGSNAPYRHPLVAVDYSDSSRLALELVVRISRPADDEIAVIHVVPVEGGEDTPGLADSRTPEARRELLVTQGGKQLARFLANVDATTHWRAAVQIGDPTACIIEAARQRGSDLIVVGSTGKGAVRRALLGSVAEAIMREATCDVLVARLPEVHA